MNTKTKLCIFILFLIINCLHGQTITFAYDDNGNRISRVWVAERLKSGIIQFPIVDSEEIALANPEEFLQEGELSTYVYPNPSRGIIRINISNMPLNSRTEARLYDLSGTELFVKRNFESDSEMDISKLKDGIYILRIKINEILFDWKIVKNQ